MTKEKPLHGAGPLLRRHEDMGRDMGVGGAVLAEVVPELSSNQDDDDRTGRLHRFV